MANDITVEILGRIGEAQIGEMIRTVTLGYAVLVQGQLNEDKPPPPAAGSMKYKSEKQRRFVMANYRRGAITVPYKRGTGSTLKGSEALNIFMLAGGCCNTYTKFSLGFSFLKSKNSIRLLSLYNSNILFFILFSLLTNHIMIFIYNVNRKK